MLRFLIVFFTCCVPLIGQTQKIVIGANDYLRFGAHNNLGLEVNIKVAYAVYAGAYIKTALWGNELGIQSRYRKPIIAKNKLTLFKQYGGGIGLALYHENSMIAWNAAFGPSINYKLGNKTQLVVSLELNYSQCAGYQKYSRIYSNWEFPIKIGLGF